MIFASASMGRSGVVTPAESCEAPARMFNFRSLVGSRSPGQRQVTL